MLAPPCPSSDTLRHALAGDPSACAQLADHLEHCATCVQRAAEVDAALTLVPTLGPEPDTGLVVHLQQLWTTERSQGSFALLQAAFDPAQAPDELGRIRHFRILAHLASGGMGHVFRAEDTHLQRFVAIKLVAEPVLVDLMQREWTVLAALRHPNIVTVYESGVLAERWPYFVMEYVEGSTLTDELAARPRSLPQRVELLRVIAHAIGTAHTLRIVHRDLKPSNIMLTPQGEVRILDFGLAKQVHERPTDLTAATPSVVSGLMGTRGYMSPEQAAGQTVDARSDVFALGVILGELCSDTPSRALHAMQARACAPTPAQRYADANEFAHDLTRWLEGYPVQAWPARWYRARLFVCRQRRALALASMVTFGLVAGLIADAVRVQRERERTEAKRSEAVKNYRRAKLAVQEYLLTITDDPELMSEGRYELRAKLLAKAQLFYEEFLAEGGTDWEVVADHADALTRLATIANALGERDRALALFEASAKQYDDLRRAVPDDSTVRAACIEAHYDVAVALTAIGRLAEARRELATAEDHLGPRHTPTQRVQYARLLNQRGWILQSEGRYPEAAGVYEEVLTIYRTEQEAGNDSRRALAAILMRLGTVRNHMRERATAKAHFEECRQLREELVKQQPSDSVLHRHLALAYERLARCALADRQSDVALRWLNQAQAIHLRLVRDYPALTNHRLYAAEQQLKHAIILRQLGRFADAEELLHASQNLITPLHDAQPAVLRWATNVGRVWLEWGYLHHAQQRDQEALHWLLKGVTKLDQVTQQAPSYNMANEVLPRAWTTIASLRERHGDGEGAAAARSACKAAETRLAQQRNIGRIDE